MIREYSETCFYKSLICSDECSLVVSPIQQTLLALVPEVIRSIYNTRSSVGQQIDVQKLNQYTPFLLQVDLLDAERYVA